MKILFFFATICILTNCFAQVDSSLKYYPLKIGNEWEYKVEVKDEWPTWPPPGTDLFYEMRTIKSDTLIDGRKYFVINSNDSKGRSEIYYERIDSLNGNVYRKKGWHDEYLIDSLNSQLHDTSNAIQDPDFGNDGESICVSVSDTILFGESMSYKSFITNYSLNQSRHTLVENIGMVNYWYSFDIGNASFELLYAKINGKIYGVSSLFSNSTNDLHFSRDRAILLYDPFPNPFNSQVKVKFEIFNRTDLKINVYNILGERIKSIVNNGLIPGIHTINIDFKTQPSGLYLIQLNNFKHSRFARVLYLK